ncbi:hypothetical protein PAXRUDRAFT_18497 [Paxillus rubicundulus Ve08.2h10]|uniref:Uncharacterized protein n=1 Tax=Paxillus rubicundulus Ve08.2h10 TaxID=930991 RepID=A0A0D0D745_9AGAM|nr:hypothetical protein PAXRUDRAFT_18497 [Paxillus rubicundulus Ve08.2h10]
MSQVSPELNSREDLPQAINHQLQDAQAQQQRVFKEFQTNIDHWVAKQHVECNDMVDIQSAQLKAREESIAVMRKQPTQNQPEKLEEYA